MTAELSSTRAVSRTFAPVRTGLLIPTWVVIGFFLLAPVLMMLVYSFLTKEFRGGVIWEFSLAAYDQFIFDRGLFGDDPPKIEWTYIVIFARSIIQAAVATLLCLIIGFPTAYFIATRSPATRSIWLFLVTVPYWVNLLIRTVSMKFLIRDNGPLNEALMGLGLINEPIALINTDFAVQLGLFYSYLPFMVLPIYASVERYDFALSEAAADLYAGRWTILRRVILPIVRPGILAGMHPGLRAESRCVPCARSSRRRQVIPDRLPDRGTVQGQRRQLAVRRGRVDDSPHSRADRALDLCAPAGAAQREAGLRCGAASISDATPASCR